MDPDEQHEDMALEGEGGKYWLRCVRGHEWQAQGFGRLGGTDALIHPLDCPRCGEEGVLLEP